MEPYQALEAVEMIGAAEGTHERTLHLKLALSTLLHSRSQLRGRGGLDGLTLKARLVCLLREVLGGHVSGGSTLLLLMMLMMVLLLMVLLLMVSSRILRKLMRHDRVALFTHSKASLRGSGARERGSGNSCGGGGGGGGGRGMSASSMLESVRGRSGKGGVKGGKKGRQKKVSA